MKYKSFKWYLKEDEDKNNFNAFVEKVFERKWEFANSQFGYFTDKYHCKDESEIYRIVFFPIQEINQLSRKSDLLKKVKGVLTSENQGHPRFFTKDDYHNIKDHLSYLSGIDEKIHGYTPTKDAQGNITDNPETDYMGIIFSQKTGANDNVDFSFYKDGNSQIQERIERTRPVLAVNSNTIKIVASLEFDDGWEIKEFSGMDDLSDNTPDEEEPEENPESQETPEGEEEEENETK